MHCRHEPQVEKRAGGQTDTITRFQLVDAFTGLLDDSGYLVPEDDRIRHKWKSALLDHQVAMAYSASMHSKEHFTRSGLWSLTFFNFQRLLRSLEDDSLHNGASLRRTG